MQVPKLLRGPPESGSCGAFRLAASSLVGRVEPGGLVSSRALLEARAEHVVGPAGGKGELGEQNHNLD